MLEIPEIDKKGKICTIVYALAHGRTEIGNADNDPTKYSEAELTNGKLSPKPEVEKPNRGARKLNTAAKPESVPSGPRWPKRGTMEIKESTETSNLDLGRYSSPGIFFLYEEIPLAFIDILQV
ncbi:predicted protein [Sclerotinia sclerotiorum 1980 UF-70]|uniref:Uncharacterized protein n=1 Tax=Sclerotinia sclerotiorum (strain ATCC 18683 / 1980 / Ss-1) TaxID=665079 RepID=A7ERC6_SCLS1|nr:predicted protein [Sclerotinia sclerotiorum 1980 UF-70]EDN92018.1 predicted protein [Sclerotinia sclerotiorum 1980 UF-70]